MSNKNETFVQVGVTALRAPDGSFLPSVPLYIKETPERAALAENALFKAAGELFADKMRKTCHRAEA